jgi:predicted Zn finger-like uncharacterized protein
MTIKVTCPACDAAYTLPDDKAGKGVRCKHCNETISVPDPEAEREPKRRRKRESSGLSPLVWILVITGGVVLLLGCGALGAIGIVVYGITSAANRLASNMPGAEPKDMNEAVKWLGEGGFRAENAAVWLERQPVDPGRRAEVFRALDKAYQAQGSNFFARDKILNSLAAWAGPGDTPLLVRSLDGGMNDKVLDVLARNPTDEGARAVANQMNGLGFFKASDTLKKMGPTAEDAVADLTLNGKDGTVKVEACRILEVIGTRKSVPKVRQAMQRDPILQYNGEQAIQKMQNR